jgi:hypothetical protein
MRSEGYDGERRARTLGSRYGMLHRRLDHGPSEGECSRGAHRPFCTSSLRPRCVLIVSGGRDLCECGYGDPDVESNEAVSRAPARMASATFWSVRGSARGRSSAEVAWARGPEFSGRGDGTRTRSIRGSGGRSARTATRALIHTGILQATKHLPLDSPNRLRGVSDVFPPSPRSTASAS